MSCIISNKTLAIEGIGMVDHADRDRSNRQAFGRSEPFHNFIL